MKESPKRILLKLSGEALGENGRLFDQAMILRVGKIPARSWAWSSARAISGAAANPKRWTL